MTLTEATASMRPSLSNSCWVHPLLTGGPPPEGLAECSFLDFSPPWLPELSAPSVTSLPERRAVRARLLLPELREILPGGPGGDFYAHFLTKAL